ncbi:Gfo/Idh/MocA family protein [Solibacillus sp. FSL H8-0538]|uniref:Gfo/Idh/MocA family protein n=1 Tax=Solibacillus sp. FSL H8-0538 TaxID=2921400 RepID=UPI0030F95C50
MNIGIMSFAHIHATSYATAIRRIPGVTLTAIYDTDVERGKEAAAQFGATFYNSEASFLQTDIEAVVICSENVLHKQMAVAAANAKKHILCEKPIATTLADAEEMIRSCEINGVMLQIAYPVRYSQPIIELKKAIDNRELGEIVAIRTTNRGQNPGGWFIDANLSGGGAVLDHTVHMVDIMRWYLSDEVVEVTAFADRYFTDIHTDDAGIMTLQFGGGVIASHDASWSRFPQFPTWGDVMIEVIGTKDTRKVDVFKEQFRLYGKEERSLTHMYCGNDTDFDLIIDFLKSVQQNKAPAITGYDGLKSLEVALAAYESSKKKQPIPL